MGGALAEHVELTFETLLVEALGVGDDRLAAVAVGGPKHDERLRDPRLPRQGSRT